MKRRKQAWDSIKWVHFLNSLAHSSFAAQVFQVYFLPNSPQDSTYGSKVLTLIIFMVSSGNSFEIFLLNHKCVAMAPEYHCFNNVMTKRQVKSCSYTENTMTTQTTTTKRTEAWYKRWNNPTLGNFLTEKLSIKYWK